MDLIIALAHGVVNSSAKRTAMTREHFSRLQKALELYKEKTGAKMVVTCSYQLGAKHNGEPFYLRSARWLRRRGVPSRDILFAPKARLTIEEAMDMSRFVREHKPRNIHVVCSDYYSQRVHGIFSTAFPNCNVVVHGIVTGQSLELQSKVYRDIRNMRRWRRARSRVV